jgi:Domain of unknown function (DUF4292)
MYKFLTSLALVGILIGMAAGCSSTKKIRKVMAIPAPPKDTVASVAAAPPEDLKADSQKLIRQTVEKLEKNRIDFRTFSAQMKVYYEGGDGKGYELKAFIRMKKDSMIWISVNVVAVVNIEVFRMLITPDSVKILDKQKKVARLRSVSYLQDEAHLPLDFKTLQDLLIGNPIFMDSSNILYYRKEQNGLSLMCMGNVFNNYLTLNLSDNTLKHSKLDATDPMRPRSCDLTYGEYEPKDSTGFSTYRKISVADKSRLDIELEYKQYRFNEPLSFSFSIPKNYKRK